MNDFWKICGGLLLFLTIAILIISGVTIPFQRTYCEINKDVAETRWELFGGCFIKDKCTGLWIQYSNIKNSACSLDNSKAQ